jgi:signal transduction histidine kinase
MPAPTLTIPGLLEAQQSPLPTRSDRPRPGSEIIPGITRAQESALLPILTSVEQVQQLSPEQAAQGYVVKLQGVITVTAPSTSQTYLQDPTGAVYLAQASQLAIQKQLAPGMLVEVRAKTVRGRFGSYVSIDPTYTDSIHLLGEASLPEPRPLSPESLAESKTDPRWSEISGVVRRVQKRIYFGSPWAAITLSSGSTRFEALCFLPGGKLDQAPLVGAEVRLRGVPSPLISERGQPAGTYLLLSSPNDITTLHPPAPASFDEPVLPIHSLPRLEIGQTASPRVHIQGTVTFVVPGSAFYVHDGTAAVRIEHADRIPKVGSFVDVLGFAEWGDWSPILQDASVKEAESRGTPKPSFMETEQLAHGNFDGALVQTDATLLHIARPASGPLLVLQNEGRVFEARFIPPPSIESLRSIPEQSRIRLTGLLVYRRPPDWLDKLKVDSRSDPSQTVPFELWLASAADVAIIARPAWWNKTRITIALSILGVVGAATAAWILTLRSQVELLTEINSAQRVREATFDERTRVARELHDSVEQELAGLTIQLDAVRARINADPQSAAAAVDTARAMLRHTREEARRSIWDLRSLVLERGDLASALGEVAEDPASQGSPKTHVHVSGTPFRLPTKIELNLVRICQEATSNARKYAQAQSITITLRYHPESLSLTIQDDGVGFDTSTLHSLRLGHFGLMHMRERAEQIDASLEIHSSQGQGTRISLHLPLSQPPLIPTP